MYITNKYKDFNKNKTSLHFIDSSCECNKNKTPLHFIDSSCDMNYSLIFSFRIPKPETYLKWPLSQLDNRNSGPIKFQDLNRGRAIIYPCCPWSDVIWHIHAELMCLQYWIFKSVNLLDIQHWLSCVK